MECEQTLAYLDQPLEIWIAQLQDDDPLIRRLAVYALSMIGPGCCSAALPALVPLLEDPEDFVRIWAAAALVRIEPADPRALQTLLAGLRDPQGFIRSLSAWHLGREGPEIPEIDRALPILHSLLEDPNASVRAEAELAIKELHTDGVRARG